MKRCAMNSRSRGATWFSSRRTRLLKRWSGTKIPMNRNTYPDPAATAEACGRHILTLLDEALASGGTASLAISGGSTPKMMFADLARQQFDWRNVHLFWVDERCVPPTHEQSNYRMAEESFVV